MADRSTRVVVVGAGIAGVAAAHRLAVVDGIRDVLLVEADNPLSLTSDKSTECYRNWWPGPDAAMTRFMSRSIDLMEQLAERTADRFVMTRRGYLFASADPSKADWLVSVAERAAEHGAGAVRVHEGSTETYEPAAEHGFDRTLTGADIIRDQTMIRRHFPQLTPETRVVAHVRRAGWLSAQQLGMTMLEEAREQGVRLVRGSVERIETASGRVEAVHVRTSSGVTRLAASHVVLAAGPMTRALARSAGVELPVVAEPHMKISIQDTLAVVPRTSPMLIWLDPQRLAWSEEERAMLAEDETTRWLTEPFPAGVHGRPDGSGGGSTLLMLFNYETHGFEEPVFPLPDKPYYPEIVLRGMAAMVPGIAAYVDKGVRPWVDGGYYVKTRENRPLIGPSGVDGLILSAAYSGFGIMAAMAGAELAGRYVTGADLPDYAPAFRLDRYGDAGYVAGLDAYADGGQL